MHMGCQTMSEIRRYVRKFVHDFKFVDQAQQGTAFLAADLGLAPVETDMTKYYNVPVPRGDATPSRGT